MRWSRIRRAALVLALAAAVAAAMLPFARAAIAAAASLLFVALVAAQIIAWSTSLRPTGPRAYDRALQRPSESPERPSDLEELERALGWGSYPRRDFDHRVRPVLERMLAYRLSSSKGPSDGPARIVDRLLEEERGPHAGRSQERWIGTEALARVVDRIEAL